MDNLDLRILNLERFVFAMRQKIAETNQRFLANSTILNNSGPMAGVVPSSSGNGSGGGCGGLAPSTDWIMSDSGIADGTCGSDSICANSYRDYDIGTAGNECIIRVHNPYSTNVPINSSLQLSPAPDLGQNAYLITRVV